MSEVKLSVKLNADVGPDSVLPTECFPLFIAFTINRISAIHFLKSLRLILFLKIKMPYCSFPLLDWLWPAPKQPQNLLTPPSPSRAGERTGGAKVRKFGGGDKDSLISEDEREKKRK